MESSRIASVPDSMFYIPNFISAEEEAAILQKERTDTYSHLWKDT